MHAKRCSTPKCERSDRQRPSLGISRIHLSVNVEPKPKVEIRSGLPTVHDAEGLERYNIENMLNHVPPTSSPSPPPKKSLVFVDGVSQPCPAHELMLPQTKCIDDDSFRAAPILARLPATPSRGRLKAKSMKSKPNTEKIIGDEFRLRGVKLKLETAKASQVADIQPKVRPPPHVDFRCSLVNV